MPDSFERESKLSRRRAARRRQIRLMEEAASGLSSAGSDDDLPGLVGATSFDAVREEEVSEQLRAMLGAATPADGTDEGVAIHITEDRTIPHPPPSSSFCSRSPRRPPSGQSRPRSAAPLVLFMFSLGCLLCAALVAGLGFSFGGTPPREPGEIGLRAHLGRPPPNGGGGDGTEVGEAREGSPPSFPSRDEADSPAGRDEIDSPIGRDEVDSPAGEEEGDSPAGRGEVGDLSEFCGDCQFHHTRFDCKTMVAMEMHQYGMTEEEAKRFVLGDCTRPDGRRAVIRAAS